MGAAFGRFQKKAAAFGRRLLLVPYWNRFWPKSMLLVPFWYISKYLWSILAFWGLPDLEHLPGRSSEMLENHDFSIFRTIFRTHRNMLKIVDFSILRNIQDLHSEAVLDNATHVLGLNLVYKLWTIEGVSCRLAWEFCLDQQWGQ